MRLSTLAVESSNVSENKRRKKSCTNFLTRSSPQPDKNESKLVTKKYHFGSFERKINRGRRFFFFFLKSFPVFRSDSNLVKIKFPMTAVKVHFIFFTGLFLNRTLSFCTRFCAKLHYNLNEIGQSDFVKLRILKNNSVTDVLYFERVCPSVCL